MRFPVLYDNSALIPAMRCGWGFACLVNGRVLFDIGDEIRTLKLNVVFDDFYRSAIDMMECRFYPDGFSKWKRYSE
ncbi:MAG TPA: hypothetical protein PKV79_10340 [Candidatus Marinimicrobia bacterium]|nr:hypothetical protein [Candidatus Neomarinimicrobiota bacterium]